MKELTEELQDKLRRATGNLLAAQIQIHEVSNSDIGFDRSKPLNVLYKELCASQMLLLVYTGDKEINEISIDIAEPTSIRIFKNVNT